MCPSGRLITFISSYKAQFVACEGTQQNFAASCIQFISLFFTETPSLAEGVHPIYQNSFEGLLHIERDASKPRFQGHHETATCATVVPVTLELRLVTNTCSSRYSILTGTINYCIETPSRHRV